MDTDAQKSRAALSSVLWSALLTVMKLIVGIMTGSLGIISEALHSGLDLLAAGGTLLAVKIAARPADEDHPYGHGKVENLTALGETLLLLATAFWVVKEAIERLLSDDPTALHVTFSWWAFAVIITSLLVDINRAAMLRRVAKATKSAALEADAAHFATDIWSSFAVLIGITGAAIAGMTVENSWLHWLLMRADVFASLIVAALILHVCKDLGKQAIDNLMDKADNGMGAAIVALMKERMPAYPIVNLRVREVGNKPYLDMVVQAPKNLHVDTAHEIADAIEALVEQQYPGAETMVHIQPSEIEPGTPEMLIRQIALTHRFGVHGLVLMHSEQGYIVFTDLELPPNAPLDAWNIAIQAFKSDVRRRIGADQVFVHVEPNIRELPTFPQPLPTAADLANQIRQSMQQWGAPLPTDIKMYTQGARRMCFVSIPRKAGLTVRESHHQLSLLNKKLAAAYPQTAKIILAYDEQ